MGRVVTLAILLATPAALAAGPADPAFAELKTLVGDWVPAEGARKLTVNFRLISGGTVLVETWTSTPGRDSMTVYHRDGGRVMATHYCPIGNQPRLVLRDRPRRQRLSFAYRDATNLPNKRRAHQHALWFEIEGDRMLRGETYRENGGNKEDVLALVRVPGTGPLTPR